MATPNPLPMREIHPQVRSPSLPGHTRPTPPMKMTPYERDDNLHSQRRSAFVPYDHGPPERKPRDSSGSVVRCGVRCGSRFLSSFLITFGWCAQRCIRRALKQLKRLMCVVIHFIVSFESNFTLLPGASSRNKTIENILSPKVTQ
jgi:hypothetical protein